MSLFNVQTMIVRAVPMDVIVSLDNENYFSNIYCLFPKLLTYSLKLRY